MNSKPGGVARLVLYLTSVVLIGALVAPWAYHAGHALAQAGIFPFLGGFPFHRYFSRSIQVTAIILLLPAVLWIGIRSAAELNLVPDRARWRHLISGFVAAVGPTLLLGAVYLICHLMTFRGWPGLSGMGRIFGSMVVVAVIEETLFRGVFLGLMLRAMPSWLAIACTSLAFAFVHFLRISKSEATGPVTWLSGFEQLPLAAAGLPPWPLWVWAAASLFLAGVILGWVTVRTRSLWFAIGLHAAWIFGQQTLQALTRLRDTGGFLPWVGPNVVSGAVPTGIAPLAAIFITGLVAWWLLRNETHR